MALEDLLGKVSSLTQAGIAKGKELAEEGIAKGKELAEISKLKVNNAAEQEAIKKAYAEIGQLYFAERGDNPEEPYAALCEKIADSKAKIEYNLERIADIKAAGGLKDEDVVCECDAVSVEDEAPVEEAPAEEAPVEESPAGEPADKEPEA